MVMLRIGDNTVNWTAPGLPTTTFRIMLAHGVAEYVPAPINAANRQRRQDIVAMLSRSGSPLSVGLAALMQSTAAGGIEFSAYLLRDDPTSLRVGPSGRGTTTHAPQGAPPPGAIGFVHTHPVSEMLLAPPSANDFGTPFQQYPYQFVVETCGRVWQLFDGRYSSLLGRLRSPPQFVALTDPSTSLVYAVVSSDTLRTERMMADLPSARRNTVDPRQQLALQRMAERERRARERSGQH